MPEAAPAQAVVCSPECREARRKRNKTSVEIRHAALLRILDREKVHKDPLRNPDTYESLLTQGCHYCKMSLLESSGICLDRTHDGKHEFGSVVPCCKTCNRVKSSGPGEHDGFTYEEMVEVIGPAIREVRIRRGNVNPSKN